MNAEASIQPEARQRHLRSNLGPRWLPTLLFTGIPLWWILGVGGFIAPILAVFVLIALLARRSVVPRSFGLWLLFLLWAVISMTQVPDLARGVAAGYRIVHYAAGAVLFVYVLNTPRDRLPIESIVRILAVFWVLVVSGGVIGMISPAWSFRTPVASILPASITAEPFVRDQVQASTSSERAFAGLGFHRPKAPFSYTNQWGAVYAVTLPFVIGAVGLARTLPRRILLSLAIVMSVVPLVFSLDRGAWLSAAIGIAYATVRLLYGRGRRSGALVLLVGLVVVAILLLATPLKDFVLVRIDRGYGDDDRLYLYTQAIDLARGSPLLGYGAPVATPGLPSIGTHGHFWTVLVSFGLPGLSLFLLWMGSSLVSTWRQRGERASEMWASFWCHVAVFTAIVQLPYYELLPWGLPVVMIAAAAAWRERLAFEASGTSPSIVAQPVPR